MADYEIEVEVGPVADGFHARLAKELEDEERRADAVKVDVEPQVGKEFTKKAKRDVQAALRALDAAVKLNPEVAKSFRRDVQKLVKEATAGAAIEVPIEATLGRGFRRDLQTSIKEATAGKALTVPVLGALAPRFRSEFQKLLNERFKAKPFGVDVAPQLSRRGMAEFTKDLRTKSAEAVKAVEASGAVQISPSADMTKFSAEVKARAAAAAAGANTAVNVNADTTNAERGVARLAGKIKSLLLPLLVTVGIAAGGLAAVFGGAVAVTANFEEQLSDLQAVAGLTADQMGELREQAIVAGRDTSFSASEAAEAQTELAKAGASVQQILDGGLNASLALAAAGSIELGDAATFVAQGLNTFGLEAEDAGRVADVLAAAANKSAADIPDIGLAMQQAGLVADSFGLSIEDTAGTLALFAQNGLMGSDAGTSFKTMLLALNPKSEEASKLMSELGFSAYDAEGNFIGLEATAASLQDALAGMTQEQRNAALQTIFGTDAIRAANLLYEAGPEGIKEWTAAVDDAGFASEVAATKLDNLKGDLEQLKGSFETAFIEAGTGAQSGLRSTVQALTGVVNTLGPQLQEILEPIAELIVQITPELGSLLEAVIPLLGTFGELAGPVLGAFVRILIAAAPYVDDLLEGLKPLVRVALSILEAFLPLLPILGDLAGEILAALVPALEELKDPEFVAALVSLAESLADMLVAVLPLVPLMVQLAVPVATLVAKLASFEPLMNAVVAGLVAYKVATAAATFVTTAFSTASAGFALNPIGLAVAAIVALGVGIFVAYKKIKPFRDLVDSVGRFLRDELVPAVVDFGKAAGRWLVSMFGKARDVFEAVYPVAKQLFSIFLRLQVGPLLKFAKALGKLFTGDFSGFVEGIKDAVLEVPRALGQLVELVGPVLLKFGSWLLTDGVPMLLEAGAKLGGALLGWLGNLGLDLITGAGKAIASLVSWIVTSAVPSLVTGAANLAGAFLSWLVETSIKLPFLLLELLGKLLVFLVVMGYRLGEAAVEFTGKFMGWVRDVIVQLPGKLLEVAGAIVGWIAETAPKVAEKALELAGSFLGWVAETITSLPGKLAEIVTAIGDWLTGLPGTVIDLITTLGPELAEVGIGLVTAMFDGLLSAGSAAADFAKDIVNNVIGFINDSIIDSINEALTFDLGFGVTIDAPDIPHIPELARGGLITQPTLALVGEAGPELVLPLTDKARMLELLQQAGVLPAAGATALAGPGVLPDATAAAAGASEGAPAVPEGLTAWVEAAVAVMAELPALVQAATVPGLTEWEAQVELLFAALGAAILATLESSRLALLTWATYGVPQATLPGLIGWRAAVAVQLLAFRTDTETTTAGTATGMAAAWQTGLDTMLVASETSGQAIVDALAGKLETGASRLTGIVTAYRDSLAEALNPILEAVGEQRLRFSAGGEVQRFARGGYVPGPDVRQDVVPALLMPGEVVIRRDSVQRFGAENLLRINDGRTPPGWSIPRYAEGGMVTGDTEGMNPELIRRLGLWSAAVGQTYHVKSGYRSMQEQARLYASYLAGTGNLAAPPGRSMHNFGLASDGNHWRSKRPDLFGLAFTVPSEAWHVEPAEARQWVQAGAIPDGTAGGFGSIPGLVPFPDVPGDDKLGKGSLALTAAAAMGFTRSKALEWAQSVQFAQPGELEAAGAGSAGAAQAALWVREAMRVAGVGDDWFQGLMTIARRESNFDPRAVNQWDSNAAKGTPSKGLMQLIDPTFRANALPGLGGIFDPVANIVAAINYIKRRYGSIENVQQANPALPPKGYALGGLVTADGLSRVLAGRNLSGLADLTRSSGPGAYPPAAAAAPGAAKVHVEGDVNLNVQPPGSHDPESYAAALGHRAVPVLAALADRTS